MTFWKTTIASHVCCYSVNHFQSNAVCLSVCVGLYTFTSKIQCVSEVVGQAADINLKSSRYNGCPFDISTQTEANLFLQCIDRRLCICHLQCNIQSKLRQQPVAGGGREAATPLPLGKFSSVRKLSKNLSEKSCPKMKNLEL